MKNPHDRIVDNPPAKPLFMNTSRYDARCAPSAGKFYAF
ncbi:hypothetical protein BN133_2779 [Cronobacter dublinensis 582]|nr:hypothetical protein BN133_2779 [Cronobacter dublinensis 582]